MEDYEDGVAGGSVGNVVGRRGLEAEGWDCKVGGHIKLYVRARWRVFVGM